MWHQMRIVAGTVRGMRAALVCQSSISRRDYTFGTTVINLETAVEQQRRELARKGNPLFEFVMIRAIRVSSASLPDKSSQGATMLGDSIAKVGSPVSFSSS